MALNGLSLFLPLDRQNSVPHLRTRLQLQQAIMKELLQRQAQEKLQQKLAGTQGAAVDTTATSNSVRKNPGQAPAAVDITRPASVSGNAGVDQQPLNQHQKTNNASVGVSPSTAPSSSPGSSPASVPLPISTTSLTAQLREQLAKLTPQQRALYMQQLTSQTQKQQQNSQQQRLVVGAASTAQVTRALGNARVSISPLNSHSLSAPSAGVKVTAQPQASIKIVDQQQQVSVGGVAVKQISSRLPVSSATASNHLGAGKVVVGSLSPSKGGGLRTGFVDVKLAPGTGKLSSPPSSAVSGKGKGRVKVEKNVADE